MGEEPALVNASGPHAAAIGRDNFGFISTGPATQITIYTHREPVSWPHRVGVVPPLAEGYQTREALRTLHQELTFGRTAVLTQVLAGLGGIGKTQLAAACAEQAWAAGELDLLVWITAASREAVLAGYAQAAWDVTDPGPGESADQLAKRFLAWLATTERRWLVVLDDLADPADLRLLWPAGPAGRVLVTTRRHDAALSGGGRAVFDIGLFTHREGVSFLAARLLPGQLVEADSLVEDLGRLPLALAQAASYIADRGLNCAEYRHRFAGQRLELPLPPDALADEYQATVTTTWSLSIDAADHLSPEGLARPLLILSALLDPNGVPVGLFETASVREYLASDYGATKAAQAVDALHSLRRLGLITLTAEGSRDAALRVHALVQRAVRESVQADYLTDSARVIADALVQAWPEADYRPEAVLMAQRLRANATILQAHCPAALWSGAHPILLRIGRSLKDTGLLQEALSYHQRLVTSAEELLGPEHLDTFTARNNLAFCLGELGDRPGALTQLEALLADESRVLGSDNPAIFTVRSNIAASTGFSGDYSQALALFEALLADQIGVLDPGDMRLIGTRSNVAFCTGETGNQKRAITLYQEVLPDIIRVRGADHPDEFTVRSNIARLTAESGDHEAALALMEPLLADQVRVLGSNHPNTLRNRIHIALTVSGLGRTREAIALFETILPDFTLVYGPDHPDTFKCRSTLGHMTAQVGEIEKARGIYEILLPDAARLLGENHSTTIGIRNNIAHWTGLTGNPREALVLYEAMIPMVITALGPSHLTTLTIRNNIAYWTGEAGDPHKALGLFHALQPDVTRACGRHNALTLRVRNHIARWMSEIGDSQSALAILETLLPESIEALGPDHPVTLSSRYNLARSTGQVGQTDQAIALLCALQPDQARILGPQHPDTLTTERCIEEFRLCGRFDDKSDDRSTST